MAWFNVMPARQAANAYESKTQLTAAKPKEDTKTQPAAAGQLGAAGQPGKAGGRSKLGILLC